MATFHRNGGNFGPEWVATFKRNGGSFAPDYAVRSARITEVEGAMIESGFGMMFLDSSEAFTEMVKSEIENAPA